MAMTIIKAYGYDNVKRQLSKLSVWHYTLEQHLGRTTPFSETTVFTGFIDDKARHLLDRKRIFRVEGSITASSDGKGNLRNEVLSYGTRLVRILKRERLTAFTDVCVDADSWRTIWSQKIRRDVLETLNFEALGIKEDDPQEWLALHRAAVKCGDAEIAEWLWALLCKRRCFDCDNVELPDLYVDGVTKQVRTHGKVCWW